MSNIFKQLQEFEKGQIRPAYLIEGGDLYLEEILINQLNKSYKKQNPRLNHEHFYGDENNEDDFLNSLTNIGMFANYQLIIFKKINQLSSGAQRRLLSYLEHPDANTLLVMTVEPVKLNNFIKALRKKCVRLSAYTPNAALFPEIAADYLAERGFGISPEALDLLVNSTDDSLMHTFSEIDKLIAYLGESRQIELSDIQNIISSTKEYQITDFIKAISGRDFNRSISICLGLIQTGAKTPFFCAVLTNHFLNVWAYPQVHAATHSNRSWEKSRIIQYQECYENYKNADFSKIFNRLREVDLLAKSTNLSDEELLVPMIFEVLNA
jgi:DNA polymerase-3 subunit delta